MKNISRLYYKLICFVFSFSLIKFANKLYYFNVDFVVVVVAELLHEDQEIVQNRMKRNLNKK